MDFTWSFEMHQMDVKLLKKMAFQILLTTHKYGYDFYTFQYH